MSETPTLFRKVLIANRGEIAVRIIRACRELGLQTVAVYSDADRKAMHVRYADQAYHIGPAAPRESYLRSDKLIEVAHHSGADAIHLGYGFLAENAAFAQACIDAGVAFIGPPPHAIAVMGDKQAARETVRAAGVPIVPGTEPGLNDDDLRDMAAQIGYPLLIKAAAGGGGKGMRRVDNVDDFRDSLDSARREAQSAFGDGRVYLERLILNGRHIEIQVLADQEGHTIYLGERECSIQRRHQKLVEESPSPFVDETMRQEMGEIAVRAAVAVGYVSAGTVEFIVDTEKNFYFLEMNTRIQVEHPVTEQVTNVDLIKEQIRIARGRRLRLHQKDVQMKGHAIECRINAEDPYNNFMPATGEIISMALPAGPGIRIDSGVGVGDAITPYYDSMIAKLICWGETRAEAILRMRRALAEFRIMGLKTNIPFHQKLFNSTRFQAGQFDTAFVEERFDIETAYAAEPRPEVAAVFAVLVAHEERKHAGQIIRQEVETLSNWKLAGRWNRIRREG